MYLDNSEHTHNMIFSKMCDREQSENGATKPSTNSRTFWNTIGNLDSSNVKTMLMNFTNEIPRLFTLLYNCLLYDFDTAETAQAVGYMGSRTTGRLSSNIELHLKGNTFVQRALESAVTEFVDLKNKKEGIQTIQYEKQGRAISFSTNNPSVTGVLTNVRKYMLHYLLQNTKLTKAMATKIAKNNNFFKLGSRKDVESAETQSLINNVIELFIKGKSVTANISKKLTKKLLDKIDDNIKALSTAEQDKYIVLGILLNHKTQGDEMQLHSVKAMKAL